MKQKLPVVAAAVLAGSGASRAEAQDPVATRVTLVAPVLIGEPARNAAAAWLPEADRTRFLDTWISVGWRVAGIVPGSALAWSLELPPGWTDEDRRDLEGWVGRVCLGVDDRCLELGEFDLRQATEGLVVRVPTDAPAGDLELRVVVGADPSPRTAMTRRQVAHMALRVALVS